MKKMKFVKVIWEDAQSIDAWTDKDEVCGSLAQITSCGILVKNTKKSLSLAVNCDQSNGNYSCIMTIPTGWIKSIKTLT